MKKFILVLAVFVIVAAGAFAQFNFAFGGGALADMSYGNGEIFSYLGYTIKETNDFTSFGGFAFLELTYFQAEICYQYSMLSSSREMTGEQTVYFDNSRTYISFNILFKYPINLGLLTLYPIGGFSRNYLQSITRGSATIKRDDIRNDQKDWLDQYSFLAGFGFNYKLQGSLYIKTEALFRAAVPSILYVNDAKDANSILPGSTKATFGFGPMVKLGIGYSF